MQANARLRKPVLAGIAISLIACSLSLLPREVLAQESFGGGTLRERLKQRLLDSRQDKQVPPQRSDSLSRIDKPGDYSFSIMHDGSPRTYRVHVPERYSAENPAALLVALHGGGGSMDFMANDKYYGLISKSEAEGFVVVFPGGFSPRSSGKFATWNAGNCCAAARDQNADDVGFIRKVVDQVSSQLSINRKQIYATGMSNGGMMAYRLACEMADTFSAIAAVAGTDNTTSCTPKAPISILHIHARNDDHVQFNGGAGEKSVSRSKVTDYVSVPATIAKWVRQNSCNPEPQRVLETPGAYCERYSECRGNVSVELCVTETGGHSWPGGNKLRSNQAPSQTLSANDVMWSFFKSTSTPAVQQAEPSK
ncbi:extracellular catalytic domain type 1 short-chain-length polyhydroxyalkanoate depolymerase [Rhodocyclus tenuis]|uniref:Polyhydroxybutyrate depolymerase n=1 Tax=Rhodocyclus tenuis TaxID=1066 RepID=A0A840G7C6_RHOTE|nr:PHB depolymerase family esterase [Rhodocyclus tenuis]MBB4248253.1 polyhydroxybutyrate depolymerase [Rhodocyclus tenuis]